MKRYYSVKFGWLFGSVGPVVQHTPKFVTPGAWVWFLADKVCVVANAFQIEDCDL